MRSSDSSDVITVKHISKTFHMGDYALTALDNVSLSIKPGEFVAIVGPSGSGKSTLMNMLGLLDVPDSGEITIAEQSISGLTDDELSILRSKTIGFVFQQFNLLARTTAAENVGLPMLYSGTPYSAEWSLKVLSAVGLEQRSDHTPAQLSGGQQQRVAIARALVNKPCVILADEPTGNLDSQSERDILDVLVRLNRAGITVVIVTHEQEVTQIAKRVIKMRDGKIISDENQTPRYIEGMKVVGDTPEDVSKYKLYAHQNVVDLSSSSDFILKIRSFSSEALRSVKSNKVRSFLSVLGILIGVAAVIAMLGLGSGASKMMEKELSGLGSNLLVVYPGNMRPGTMQGGSSNSVRLFTDDVDVLAKELTDITGIAPRSNAKGLVQYEEKTWNTSIVGTTPEYAKLRASAPDVGRNFSEFEDRSRARVALIGRTVVKNIFGDKDPIGSDIKINRIYFQVIGILPAKGANGFQDQDDIVVIPLETALRRVFGQSHVQQIDVQVTQSEKMPRVEAQIKGILRQRKGLSEEKFDENITIRNMADIQNAIASTNKIMSLLLSIVASISLLVGGIGVMNIMLVSVTERTREIGLRKALGATRTDILSQFLIEAGLLSILGGGLGILFGWLIATITGYFTQWPFDISPSAIAIVAIITGMIGVIFGFWPAKKASALQPIQALKYE